MNKDHWNNRFAFTIVRAIVCDLDQCDLSITIPVRTFPLLFFDEFLSATLYFLGGNRLFDSLDSWHTDLAFLSKNDPQFLTKKRERRISAG